MQRDRTGNICNAPHRGFSRVNALAAMLLAAALAGCAVQQPLAPGQIDAFAERLHDDIVVGSLPVEERLTLKAAIKRAMQHNLAIKAREFEVLVAEARAGALHGAMLPKIVGESEFYRRSRPSLSRSSNSGNFSTSSDIQSISSNLSLSLNILDFGLSYVRARQGLDKAFQQREDLRRLRQRIAEETHSLYWRAVAFELVETSQRKINAEVEAALAASRRAGADRNIDPSLAIGLQRDILNTQRELNQLHVSLAGAADQLRQAIAAPPGSPLRLELFRPERQARQPARDLRADVALALRQRPEVRTHMYDIRIARDEAYAAILQSLPGVTLANRMVNDSNSFLKHASWLTWSAAIAGNLMNLARLPLEMNTIEAQQQAHRAAALATAAVIAMQVHASHARLAVNERAWRDAARFHQIQNDMLRQVQTHVRHGRTERQALVREKLSVLLAQARMITAWADVSASQAAQGAARGDDPAADTIASADAMTAWRQ